MKRMKLRKTVLAAALVGATALGTTALVSAQPGGYGPGYGMGPGMMGPGMMGGCGPGAGGGYGPGHGMGPGMMGGGRMGPGSMGGGMGYGTLYQLGLSPDQWNKVNAIDENLARKNWELAGKTQEEAFRLRNLMSAEKRDRHAVTNQYKKLQEARLQSFQAQLDAQEKIEGVFTKEQKDQLRRFAPWWGQHME